MNNTIIRNVNSPMASSNMMMNINGGYTMPQMIVNVQSPVENFNSRRPMLGIRESCEDVICPCDEYARSRLWDQYKACKQQCFINQKQAINDCCLSTCGNNKMCSESCNTPLVYGQLRRQQNRYMPSQNQVLNL